MHEGLLTRCAGSYDSQQKEKKQRVQLSHVQHHVELQRRSDSEAERNEASKTPAHDDDVILLSRRRTLLHACSVSPAPAVGNVRGSEFVQFDRNV